MARLLKKVSKKLTQRIGVVKGFEHHKHFGPKAPWPLSMGSRISLSNFHAFIKRLKTPCFLAGPPARSLKIMQAFATVHINCSGL
jgi:hypothetical protein